MQGVDPLEKTRVGNLWMKSYVDRREEQESRTRILRRSSWRAGFNRYLDDLVRLEKLLDLVKDCKQVLQRGVVMLRVAPVDAD